MIGSPRNAFASRRAAGTAANTRSVFRQKKETVQRRTPKGAQRSLSFCLCLCGGKQCFQIRADLPEQADDPLPQAAEETGRRLSAGVAGLLSAGVAGLLSAGTHTAGTHAAAVNSAVSIFTAEFLLCFMVCPSRFTVHVQYTAPT